MSEADSATVPGTDDTPDTPDTPDTSAHDDRPVDEPPAGSEPSWRRPGPIAFVVLGLLAYVPALTAAPGRMPADSKLYLYLDPGRFLADAAGTFDPRQFAGWVPHQHVAYLWPSGPWFWVFDRVGSPDWIAHRLWIGTILLAAGLGVRWCGRQLGLVPLAAVVAAVVYQVSPYVLPYVSRTSVMLLPWAGLGWIVGLTVRATRSRGWREPALIALVVLTVGAVNATALLMIVPAPVVWLVHAVWARLVPWRAAVSIAVRTAALSAAVSSWWLAGLVVQGRYGADVLRYSESLADVAHTATSAEVWRGLGYWLFYIRDPFLATTTESLRYLASTPAIAVSYAVPIACLAGLVWVRWIHRRFAILLVATGALLAVGVHPSDDRAPLVDALTGGGDAGIALALRSSTRALPVMNLGLALGAGALVAAARSVHWRRWWLDRPLAVGIVAVVLVNMPGWWTGAFVDPALERDQDPPAAWIDAAAALDADRSDERVLMLPGTEFGAYRWGYTVDQPLPGLTEADVVTRDLLPLGSPAAMDLWYAYDDRFQDGVAESSSLAAVARLFAADTVWLTNDLADDRFATARPEVVRDVVLGSDAVAAVDAFGEPTVNVREFAPVDGRALTDPRVGVETAPVELVELAVENRLVRAYAKTILVAGSGDGVVDAAAAGLLTADVGLLYSADDPASAPSDIGILVTDSNRDRDRHWRSSQDATGFTESGGPGDDVLGAAAPDARLPIFDTGDEATQTVALQQGPVRAVASRYGEPFAYTPEDRAYMAIDGDPGTAWSVGEHGDPLGATIELTFPQGSPTATLILHQSGRPDDRRVTAIELTEADASGWVAESARVVVLDGTAGNGDGHSIALDPDTVGVRVEIVAVGGGLPGTAGAVAGVGFAELDVGLGPTLEVVRAPFPPLNVPDDMPLGIVLTRLRVDPMDRWRSDPEPTMVREFFLEAGHVFDPAYTVRIDARAPDGELAAVFDWPVIASSRLAGSLRSAGVAAFDGDDATAWTTGFGEALGAALVVDDVDRPITSIEVDQVVGDFSVVRRIQIRSGGETRDVALTPDGDGTSTAAVDPPLPPGPLEIVLTEVEARTTVDRRFGDVVELPASISEVSFQGAPAVAPLGSSSTTVACEPLATIDDDELSATITIDGSGWLDGGPLRAHPCQPTVALGAGPHVLQSLDGVLQLDRVVMDDSLAAALAAVDDRPATMEAQRDRFGGRYVVDGCPAGCWFTFGEGFNEAWSASIAGADLGPPTLIDGGFNGWWVMPTEASFEVEVAWTVQRPLTIAMILSGLAALGCLVVALRGRRAKDAPLTVTALATDRRPLDRRNAIVVGSVWAAAGLLLVGPEGLVLGVGGGLALVWSRRRDLPALAAISTVVAVAAYVVVNERRWSPMPDGGWPIQFERVHEIGVFAAVSLLVAAIAADDGDVDANRFERRSPRLPSRP